ncbi:MAG: hypothetical protein ACXABY_00330 [Candidatus Thorarchaeota archaeon]|jgi:hypothetical protein
MATVRAFLYRVWCTTDEKWEYTSFLLEDDGAPTVCPENPAHGIDTNKTSIELERGLDTQDSFPMGDTLSPWVVSQNSSWKDARLILYPGSIVKDVFRFRAILSTDHNTVEASVRIYDITNSQTIAEVNNVTFAEADIHYIVDLGNVSNVPEEQAIWTIQVRRDAGTGVRKVRLSTLAMFY